MLTSIIKDYKIEQVIKESTYKTYIAYKDNLKVILKIISNNSENYVNTYLFKKDILKACNLNLIEVVDIQDNDNEILYSYKYIEGVPLSKLDYKKLNINEIMDIMLKILYIIKKAHDNDIYHLNIHPDNIIYNALEKSVSVIDFALHHIKNKRTLYNPPEFTFIRQENIDYSLADVYQLGVLFYQILTNKLPFKIEDNKVYIKQIKTILPPDKLNKSIPKYLSDLILNMLDREPVSRPAIDLVIDTINKIKNGDSQVSLHHKTSNHNFNYPPFVGREDEIFSLYKEIDRFLIENRGDIIFIKGKESIGKTRLISEVLKLINKEFNIIEIKSSISSNKISYYLIKELLFQFLIILKTSDKSFNNLKINKDIDIKELINLIYDISPDILDFIFSHKETNNYIEDEGLKKEKFITLLSNVIDTIIEKYPHIIIIMENLENADKLSLEILDSLRHKLVSKVLIICVFNSEHNNKALEKFVNNSLKDYAKIIEISELTYNEVETLIQKILNNYSKETIFLSSLIYNISRGNPFFTIQVLKYFMSCFVYDKENNIYKIEEKKIKEIKVPEFLFEPIAKIIYNLSQKTFNFLKILSILGDGFDLESLSFIGNLTLDDIQSIIKELIDNSIIYEKNHYSKKYYYFTHIFIRDVSLNLINSIEKYEILENVLNILVELYNKNKKENILITIINLALQKDNKEKFLNYFYKAAYVYKNDFWYDEAVKYFKTIIQIIEEKKLNEDELYFDSIFQIANISNITGDLNTAIKYALKLTKTDIFSYKIKGFYTIGEASFKKGEYDNAITYFNRVIKLLKGKNYLEKIKLFYPFIRLLNFVKKTNSKEIDINDIIFINSLYFLIWIYSFTNYKNTKPLIFKLKRYTDSLSPSNSYYFTGFKVLANFYISTGKINKAKNVIKKALIIAKNSNNKLGIAICYQLFGYIYQIQGKYDDSIIFLKTSIEYFEKLREIREIAISLLILSYNYYYKSDYNNATKTYSKFTSIFSETNDYYGILSSLIIQAKIFIEKSDYKNAEKVLNLSYKISNEKGIDYVKAYIGLEIAKIAIKKDNINEARSILKKSYQFFKSSGSFMSYFVYYYPIYLSTIVEEYKSNNFASKKEKADFIRKSIKDIKKTLKITDKLVNYKYIALREAARFYEEIGKNKKAFYLYKKSIEGLEKHGRLYELALTLYYFAIFLQKNRSFNIDYVTLLKKSFSIFSFINNEEYINKIKSIINVNIDTQKINEIDSMKLKMIIGFNTQIAGVLDLKLLLDLILDYSIKITGAERGIIFLKDESNNIEPVAYKALEKIDTRFPKEIVEEVINSGNKIITTNIDKIYSEISSYNIRSVLCVPIKKETNIIGAIYLDNTLINGTFTDEEVNLLSIFTNQAYVSIENAKLHKKVIRDELTGTLSRLYFEFLIDKEIARAERYQSTFSLLNIDIDNFSFIMDMYGNKAGENILKNVSSVISECIRSTDYLARYYDDKFFVLAPETDIVGSEILAKRILNKIREYKFENIENLKLTVSIGIANYPYNSVTKSNLISLAEDALKNAKKIGKDCYFIQKSTRFIDEKDIYLDSALSKLEKVSSVIKITHDISTLVNVEKVIEKILDKSLKILGEERGLIAIENETTGKLEILSYKGFDNIPEFIYTIIENSFKNSKETYIRSEEFVKYNIDIIDKNISGIITIPIKYKKDIKGIFLSYLKRKIETSDIMVLNIILTQAAVSIENAKFYKIGVEIQRLEAEKQYLERINKLKNEFINILSHDLKSPVAKIKMVANLIREYYKDFDEKQKEEFLREIESSSEFVLKLIENLLDISRIERGEFKIEKEEVNFVEFIANVIRENIILARNKGIKINYEYSENVPPMYIDKIKITQVCNNFISNAIKFSPLDSEITIKVTRDNGNVVFSVKDDGPGIPLKERENIFKKEFYQTSVKPTKGEKGTGLGLFISKKIITIHGGTIGFESEEGKGSTFYFKLPIS